jgi:hypothetical protein
MGKTKNTDAEGTVDGRGAKMGRKAYEHELARLQGELVALQEWVNRPARRSASSSRAATPPARPGRSSASPSA